ncbi:MAG: type II toxin-antitoxin system RelE/ParE family toxin [Acidimicrobiia bacterium]
MSYAIEFEPKAARQLARIPQPDRRRIIARIELLGDEPRPNGVEKLEGFTNLYRVRQGNYRIVYSIDDGLRIVTIARIGQRGSVYR